MKKLVLISLLAMGSGVAGCCGDGSGDHAGHSNASAASVASTGSGNALNAGSTASTGSSDHAEPSNALEAAGVASIASEDEARWIWKNSLKKKQKLLSKDGRAELRFELLASKNFSYFEISLSKSGPNEYKISTTDNGNYRKLHLLELEIATPIEELRASLPRFEGEGAEQKTELDILESRIEYVLTDEEGQTHKSDDKEVSRKLIDHNYKKSSKQYWVVTRKADFVGKYGWQITEEDVEDEAVNTYQIDHGSVRSSLSSSSSSSWGDAGSVFDQHNTDEVERALPRYEQTHSVVRETDPTGGKITKTTTTRTTTSSTEVVDQSQHHEVHMTSAVASDAHSEQSEVLVEQQPPSQVRLNKNKNKQTGKNK